jgi:hypothetical protein
MKQMSQMRNILQHFGMVIWSVTYPRKFSTVLADFSIAGTNLQATLTREALRWKGSEGKLVYSSMRVGA